MSSYDFGTPGFFTTGAVGRPGQRTFFLQAGQRGQVATLKIEKEQVAALAEHLAALLDKVATGRTPEDGTAAQVDLALREPVHPAWVVGSIGVAYEEEPDRVVIVFEELRRDDEEETPDEPPAGEAPSPPGEPAAEGEAEAETPAATARFRLTRGQARAFVNRARQVVKAGRPSCPVCGRPIDPDGHVCPRANGRAHLGRPR